MRYRSFVWDSLRWSGFEHRPGDIVISTPPKCGTTWVQNIVAMLVLGTTTFDRPVAGISPWLDQVLRPIDEVLADLAGQEHRRFIKTHTPIDGLPQHDDVTYISVLRDPRDAAVSWDHHVGNVDPARLLELRGAAHGFDDLAELPPMPDPIEDAAGRWWAYMQTRAPQPEFAVSLELVARHATVAWARRHEPNVVMVHYAELQQDLGAEVDRIATQLGIEVDEAQVGAIAAAASFASMRRRAGELVPNAGQIWVDERSFFHRGTSGQWREVVGEDADDHYQAVVRELIDDEELLSWLHRP